MIERKILGCVLLCLSIFKTVLGMKTRFTAGLLTSDSCYPEEQLINRGRGALQEWPVSHLPPVTVDKDVKKVDPCTLVVEM